MFLEERVSLVRVSFINVFGFRLLFSTLSHFWFTICVLPAAGFANGEEVVNMSAVLTGMGPIPKNSDATRSLPVLA